MSELDKPKNDSNRTAAYFWFWITVILAVLLIIVATNKAHTVTKTGDKPVTVTKDVTPESCKQLIDTDNDIMSTIGSALNQYGSDMTDPTPLDNAATHIQDVTPQRQALVSQCEGN